MSGQHWKDISGDCIVLYCIVLYCVMLCYGMLCCVVLCYVTAGIMKLTSTTVLSNYVVLQEMDTKWRRF